MSRWHRPVVVTSCLLVLLATGAAGFAAAAPALPSDSGSVDATPQAANETAVSPHPKLSAGVVQLANRAARDTPDSALVTHATSDPQLTVRIAIDPGGESNVTTLIERAGGTVRTSVGGVLLAAVPIDAMDSLAATPEVNFVRLPEQLSSTTGAVTSEGLGPMNVSSTLHTAGVNGSGVTVAVIDTGFNASNPEIADNVAGVANLSAGGGPFVNRSGQHGTAVAELVVDTAPNVSLVLVEVAFVFDIQLAIEHLETNTSVDAVSMSLGTSTGPFDGTSPLDDAIAGMVANGTPWAVSAGNDADGHHLGVDWSDPDGDGLLNVDGTDERVDLVGSPTSGTIWINWDDYPTSHENYDAYLYDTDGTLIAQSETTQNGAQPPEERLSWSGADAAYLQIERVNANGTATFDIFAGSGIVLEPHTSGRSLTRPATEEMVLTIGAVDYQDIRLRPYSARGPTIDGDRKPELVAPDGVSTATFGTEAFAGTSAAAPHTAGVIALLLDRDPALTSGQVRDVLAASATPLNDTAPNNRTGHGLVNATRALAIVESMPPFPAAPGVNVSDRRYNPRTSTNLTVVFNASGVVSGPSAVALRVTNDTGASREFDGFDSERAGVEVELPRSILTKNETLTVRLLDNATQPPDELATDRANLTINASLDQTPPTISNATAVDADDEDGNVTGGNRVTVAVEVSDVGFGVDTVTANASAFGAGQVTLTKVDTRRYSATFTVTTANASPDGAYPIHFRAVDLARNANETSTEPLTLDTTSPTLTNVTTIDRTDGDGEVSDGDVIEVAVDASDAGTALAQVTANAEAFGAGTVSLTDVDDDGRFNATFTVDGTAASSAGTHPVLVIANDTVGNSANATSDGLELREVTSVNAGQPGFGAGLGVFGIILASMLAGWLRRIFSESGS